MIPFMLLNNGCKFLCQSEKVREIEVQITSINLKVIQKEKMMQTKLLGYL